MPASIEFTADFEGPDELLCACCGDIISSKQAEENEGMCEDCFPREFGGYTELMKSIGKIIDNIDFTSL